ncbi:MAG TPA: TIGR01777 family oxidoreductase [Microbacteriaceae bacterium]|nr:TIGR01777 family oxidoreductase [Microbacteriaceae bacterium]
MSSKIILAGASGLIGTALKEALNKQEGLEVHTLVRGQPRGQNEHSWDPDRSILDADLLANAQAVISLSGASVGRLPWTQKYKKLLVDSRINSTSTIANSILKLEKNAPLMWISASAVGFYGSKPGEVLTEDSEVGHTFLASLCDRWEKEALRAKDVTKVALLRTAPVIHPEGVLKPMIKLTKFGLAGPLAGGKQKWPWISLEDEVRAVIHILKHQIEGPVNLTGPTIATANDIGRELAKQMRRPFLIPAPRFALHMALGKDATQSLLTSDAEVLPKVLENSGFEFLHDTPKSAITASLS